jgi:putative transposase
MLFGRFPFLEKLYADSAYQGPIFADALGKIPPRLEIETVKRSDHVKGFVTLPKRWIVERTIAWLNRGRRLAKDWENLNLSALMFLRFASIRLMLRKLCNPVQTSGTDSDAIGGRGKASGSVCDRIKASPGA